MCTRSLLSRFALAVSTLVALAALPLPAEPVWRAIGPTARPTVIDLTIDPSDSSIVYAALKGGGIARSADAGATWTMINRGLSDPIVNDLAIDPLAPTHLFAATSTGVFRSLDSGRQWRPAPHLAANVLAIETDPRSPGSLFALTVTALLRSFDGGTRWQTVALPPQRGTYLRALAVDANDPRSIYVSYYARRSKLLKSADGGIHWFPIFAGTVDRIVTDPVRPNVLWIDSDRGGLRTVDGGASWTRVLSGGFQALALDPSAPNTAYAATSQGIQKTDDAGLSWRILLRSGPPVLSLALPPDDPTRIYAGTSLAGLLVSPNGGERWNESDRGMINSRVAALSLAVSDSTLFAGAKNAVYQTENRGGRWVNSLLVRTDALAVAPSDPQVIYATTAATRELFYRSTTGGNSWLLVAEGKGGWALAVDPHDAQVVYLAGAQALDKSIDGGISWTRLPISGNAVVAVDPFRSGVVYSASDRRVMRSTDGGTTWRVFLDTGAFGGRRIRGIAVAPGDSDTVYASDWRSVYGTHDGGRTWRRLTGELENPKAIAIDPSDPLRVTVGTARGAIRSIDGGITWKSFDRGLFGKGPVQAILHDPVDPRRLYAAAAEGGVFMLEE